MVVLDSAKFLAICVIFSRLLLIAPTLDVKKLATFDITGGQINLIVKNTAYKVAVKQQPVFSMKDFIDEIKREKDASFDSEKSMGFLS